MVTLPQEQGLIKERHRTWLPVSQRARTRTWGKAAGARLLPGRSKARALARIFHTPVGSDPTWVK
jgi:hypothetical protein